jgi:hypothetical protein
VLSVSNSTVKQLLMLVYTDAYLQYTSHVVSNTIQEVVIELGADVLSGNSPTDDATGANGYANISLEVLVDAGVAGATLESDAVVDISKVRTV